jgi:two-component system C4-dicarboxylate transport sensor histidine kinase DctB
MKFKLSTVASKTRITLIIGLAIALLIGVNEFSVLVFQANELEKGRTKLSLYQVIIDNELSRLQHLPALLAQDFEFGNVDKLNREFKSIALSSHAEAIYALDQTGMTIAASNFDRPKTFLGQNYQFRRYFTQAMNGLETSFFAIGATTSRPGYFLAAPIADAKNPIGAVVVKLDLTALNNALESTGDKVVVTNKEGIVVLSSVPTFRYRTTRNINLQKLLAIKEDRQFGNETLAPLTWAIERETIVVESENYLLLEAQLEEKDWQLFYLADANVARTRAFTVSSILAASMIAASALLFILRERRVRKALETSQKDRRRLQREIEVRRKAEERLESAQTALKRTSKLAALGQLSASVTHELGQPISAMKNHIAAEMLVNTSGSKVMSSLSGIVDRMDNITKQLKFFATPDADFDENIDIFEISKRAVELMRYDFEHEKVDVRIQPPVNRCLVNGNSQRLEQVIINILRNSLVAMQGTVDKCLELSVKQDQKFCIVSIRDNGHGLLGQSLDQIIEPFHTTGASGKGMGLGLAISSTIIEEHGGTILAADIPQGGVLFEVKIPRSNG